MKKYLVFSLMAVLLLLNDAAAQFKKISGRVSDFLGNPVPRASIFFKGGRNYQVVSDNKGNFNTIRNSLSDTIIVCRQVNFKTVEMKIENANTVNFKLYPKEDVHYLQSISDSLIASVDSADLLSERYYVDSIRANESDKIFSRVESDPYFDGGEAALRAYYKFSLRNSKVPVKYSVNGIITIGFLIKNEGSISNVKLIKGINRQIDDAVIKSTENMPKWRPAIQNGRNYEFNYVLSIPINIKVKPR